MAAGLRYHEPHMKAQAFFAQAMRVVLTLWGALTFSNVLLGVLTVVVPSRMPPPKDLTQVAILGALAVGVAIASFVVPARMQLQMARQARAEVAEPEPMPGGMRGPARFAQPEKAARAAMGLALTPFIMSMALSEAVSLLGLVVHMQGAAMTISTPFIVAGTLLAAIRFPTVARMVGPFERAHGATFAASTGPSY